MNKLRKCFCFQFFFCFRRLRKGLGLKKSHALIPDIPNSFILFLQNSCISFATLILQKLAACITIRTICVTFGTVGVCYANFRAAFQRHSASLTRFSLEKCLKQQNPIPFRQLSLRTEQKKLPAVMGESFISFGHFVSIFSLFHSRAFFFASVYNFLSKPFAHRFSGFVS